MRKSHILRVSLQKGGRGRRRKEEGDEGERREQDSLRPISEMFLLNISFPGFFLEGWMEICMRKSISMKLSRGCRSLWWEVFRMRCESHSPILFLRVVQKFPIFHAIQKFSVMKIRILILQVIFFVSIHSKPILFSIWVFVERRKPIEMYINQIETNVMLGASNSHFFWIIETN